MEHKLNVGVLYGGISSEREISINTGNQVIQCLDKSKYNVIPLMVNEEKDIFNSKDCDFVFNALHGAFGEDGRVQGILDVLNVKYNGCGFLTSSICMNKDLTKRLLSTYGIKMAKSIIINNQNKNSVELDCNFKFPVIIKPNSGGSSLGVFLAKTKQELLKYVNESLGYDKDILIEEYIDGDEISCGVLDSEVLPIFSIIPQNGEFFDYKSKYDDTTIETLSNFDNNLDKKIKDIVLKCYDVLGCKVYARIDFIIKDGEPYFLEINTLPGMTKGSIFPKMAKSIGIEFGDLLEKIIDLSFSTK